MNTTHLTETQLQLYADDITSVTIDLKEHVTHCANCQVKLENYRHINSALKAMPAPAFDFDLADEVLASLPVKKAPFAWVPLLAAIMGILLIGLMVSGCAERIAALFSAVPKVWGYVLTVPALVFMLVQFILLIAEHQRKMSMLLNK